MRKRQEENVLTKSKFLELQVSIIPAGTSELQKRNTVLSTTVSGKQNHKYSSTFLSPSLKTWQLLLVIFFILIATALFWLHLKHYVNTEQENQVNTTQLLCYSYKYHELR